MGILDRLYDDKSWEHKNRPKNIKNIILPPRIKNAFIKKDSLKDVGNLLLSGPRGTGKTTLAACISDNSDRDTLYINMSLDTGIDGIRDKVIEFISTSSFSDDKKIVIGDEFDRLSTQGMDSLKSTIERYSSNVNFIFISNHRTKLTPEVMDRLNEIDFNFTNEESKLMKKDFFKRVCTYLKNDQIEFDQKAVGNVINMTFPSMRKTWIVLQNAFKTEGKITEKFISKNIASDIDELFVLIKNQDYTEIKKYIANQSIDLTTFYSLMYNQIDKQIASKSYGEAVILLAKYQYESNFSVDKSIPLSAMCVNLSELEFK